MTTPAAIQSHVAAVRRKMILQRFVRRFALTLLVLGAAVWGVALALRLFATHLPGGPWVWIGGGVAVAAVVAYLMALRNAPTPFDAAVAIDERLGLKEKFSTALAFAGSDDPFAGLAVADAGRAAGKVDLRRKFPISWPKLYYGVPFWALLVLLTLWLVPSLDFSSPAVAKAEVKQQIDEKASAEVQQIVKNGMDALATLPPEVAERQELRVAKDQLAQARDEAGRDPAGARQTAREAQDKLAEAIKQQIEKGQKYAQAREDAKTFRGITPPAEEQGPVADAHRAMAQAKFDEAIKDLSKTVDQFDKMSQADQQKAAEQMKQLAQSLQQAQTNPQAAQQAQQQMQQMGMTQQQAQQAQQLAQQAAQGSQAAQQQLQQMAQAAQQQMNNGQGATPQQQQQMQQAVQQMQQQAQSSATAQQMGQMAQQMAQAMQQAASPQAGGQQQPQQSQQPQAGQQGGQQQGGPQQQQPGGQPPQQGQGQPQAGGQGQQQMQGAGQQMQDALAQMQAVQQDAAQMQAAQAAQAAMAQGQQGQGQPGGQAPGQGAPGGQQGQPGQGQGQPGGNNPQASDANFGKWAAGDPKGQGGGGGGPGQGAGGRAPVAAAPFGFTPEVSKSHDDSTGKTIASTLIKADALKGESKATVQQIVESETKEATDEVDQQRVSRQAQQAVKQYFQSMAKDAGAAKTPAKEPGKK